VDDRVIQEIQDTAVLMGKVDIVERVDIPDKVDIPE
jgi:hypothetical protein